MLKFCLAKSVRRTQQCGVIFISVSLGVRVSSVTHGKGSRLNLGQKLQSCLIQIYKFFFTHSAFSIIEQIITLKCVSLLRVGFSENF